MKMMTNYKSFDGKPISVGNKIECLNTGMIVHVFQDQEGFKVAFSAYHLSKKYFLTLQEFCKDPVKILK